jgi:hypothetical protein
MQCDANFTLWSARLCLISLYWTQGRACRCAGADHWGSAALKRLMISYLSHHPSSDSGKVLFARCCGAAKWRENKVRFGVPEVRVRRGPKSLMTA